MSHLDGQHAAQPEEDARLWRALFRAAERRAVDEALRGLYARLDAAVTERRPTCRQSGKCCKFDSYGHRLYVTALEIAWFLRQAGAPLSKAERGLPLLAQRDACAYQVDGLCSVHAVRPLGCRVFFCERGTEAWQQDVYERFLGDLRGLHERLGVPYRYLEWRAGLDEALGAAERAGIEWAAAPHR